MDCRFENQLGSYTVNEEVVLKVAGYAALECYGIVGMASKRSTDGIVQILGLENIGRGVIIHIDDNNSVDVELYIIVEYGISIAEVCKTIVDTVRYKLESMTGVKVRKIAINVEGIRV